jgi:hypothetical protein
MSGRTKKNTVRKTAKKAAKKAVKKVSKRAVKKVAKKTVASRKKVSRVKKPKNIKIKKKTISKKTTPKKKNPKRIVDLKFPEEEGLGALPEVRFDDINDGSAVLKKEFSELLFEDPPMPPSDEELGVVGDAIAAPLLDENDVGFGSATSFKLPPLPEMIEKSIEESVTSKVEKIEKPKKKSWFSKVFTKKPKLISNVPLPPVSENKNQMMPEEVVAPDIQDLEESLAMPEFPEIPAIDDIPGVPDDLSFGGDIPEIKAPSEKAVEMPIPKIVSKADFALKDLDKNLESSVEPVVDDVFPSEDDLVLPKEAETTLTPSPASTSGMSDHNRRYAHYLDNLKRRVDHETRERTNQAVGFEKDLKAREKKLDAIEENILKKETEMMAQEKQYSKIKQLQQELEDKDITLNCQKEEITEVHKKLRSKEAALKNLEKELTKKEKALLRAEKNLEKETQKEEGTLKKLQRLYVDKDALKVQLREEDEAIGYLSHMIDDKEEHYRMELERLKEVLATKGTAASGISKEPVTVKIQKQDATIPKPKATKVSGTEQLSVEVEDLLSQCYGMISSGDVPGAKSAYKKVCHVYKRLKSEKGEDDILIYHKVLELYDDIGLAEVGK